MIITKGKLREIIQEELENLSKKKPRTEKEKREINTARKKEQRKQDDLRWGGTAMRQLARGVVEDNNYFDADGHFTSKGEAKTFSNYFTKGIRRNLRGKTHSDVSVTGRGKYKNKGTGTHKVDGTKKESVQHYDSDTRVNLSMKELAEIVDDCILEFISELDKQEKPKVIEQDSKINWDKECKRRGYRVYADLLNSMDALVRAGKGELRPK